MPEEYIKSLLNECIAAAIPEEEQPQLIDLSEPSVPHSNPKFSELKHKIDELKSRLQECDSHFPEKIDSLRCLLKENRELNKHVSVIDAAFSDLVQKYEKAKMGVLCYKQREDIKKDHNGKMADSIERIEEKYHGLKAHANAEIEKANAERLKSLHRYETELQKYTTLVKGMRIKYENALQDYQRKTKELSSLECLFDEINTDARK